MERPHAVMLPLPGQSHINPMLQLAQLLHSKGFYITFVNTETCQQSILRAQGPDALQGHEDFQFETIPDGLVSSSSRSQERVIKQCMSTYDNCVAPFGELLARLNSTSGVPCITCIVYNWLMSFALDVAKELSIPVFAFMTMSACGFMPYLYLDELIQRGYIPLKDESYLTNGYLDTSVDWIPGMKDIRLRDLPSYVRTVDGGDFFLNYDKEASKRSLDANGLILNTFDFMDAEVLNALKVMFYKVYTVGPLLKLLSHTVDTPCKSMRLHLWQEDYGYKEWLNAQKPCSVIYVSFGSITTVSSEQLNEFAWGLANSNYPFLWVVRPDLMQGDRPILAQDFIEETKERSYLCSWCTQEEVLSHASVGGFLSHCGWNSTLVSISDGQPMICWPGFSEQYMNARYVCKEWGIGMEIDIDVKREHVTSAVKELMEGEKGKELRKSALKWKEKAMEATTQGGSSYENIERLVQDLNLA